MINETEANFPKVIFCIGGMARTGSTALCNIISSRSGALNVGELVRLNRYRAKGMETNCSCGQRTDSCEFYRFRIDDCDFRRYLQKEHNVIVDNSKFVVSFFRWLRSLQRDMLLVYVFVYRPRSDVVNSIVKNLGPEGPKNPIKANIGWFIWTLFAALIFSAIKMLNMRNIKSVFIYNSGKFEEKDLTYLQNFVVNTGEHIDHQVDGNYRYR